MSHKWQREVMSSSILSQPTFIRCWPRGRYWTYKMLLHSQSSWFFTETVTWRLWLASLFSSWANLVLEKQGNLPEEAWLLPRRAGQRPGSERKAGSLGSEDALPSLWAESLVLSVCVLFLLTILTISTINTPSDIFTWSQAHRSCDRGSAVCSPKPHVSILWDTQTDRSNEMGSCHWILTNGMCGKWWGSLPSLALKKKPMILYLLLRCRGSRGTFWDPRGGWNHSAGRCPGPWVIVRSQALPPWAIPDYNVDLNLYWLFVIAASLTLLIEMLLEGVLI